MSGAAAKHGRKTVPRQGKNLSGGKPAASRVMFDRPGFGREKQTQSIEKVGRCYCEPVRVSVSDGTRKN
jgi:hypothetical protein